MDINSYRSKGNLSIKELISLKQPTQNDIFELLYSAKELKTMYRYGEHSKKINGKNIMLFTKSAIGKSRIAFEIATRSIDGNPIILNLSGSHIDEMLKSDESIRVIARYGINSVVIDTSVQDDANIISRCLNIPVINANEQSSPCQAIAALLTIWEKRGKLSGLKATIISDVNTNENSLLYAFAKSGIDITIVSPSENAPSKDLIDYLNQFCEATYSDDLLASLKACDIIFCFSHAFGEDYKITDERIEKYCPNAIFIQNIPLTREKEASSTVIDSPNSLIYEQGENVMYAISSAIYLLSK